MKFRVGDEVKAEGLNMPGIVVAGYDGKALIGDFGKTVDYQYKFLKLNPSKRDPSPLYLLRVGSVTNIFMLEHLMDYVNKKEGIDYSMYPNKCPLCSRPAWVSFSTVDCTNPLCDNFDRKLK